MRERLGIIGSKKEGNQVNSDKKQQDKNQIEQDSKNKRNDQSPNQTDGFRYDYDDSSDLK